MTPSEAQSFIQQLLYQDRKINSYKFALLRSIKDVACDFITFNAQGRDIAVPLRLLADYWFAYYYPFVNEQRPIWQGQRSRRDPHDAEKAQDMAFRPILTEFRQQWAMHYGDQVADGHFIVNQMRRSHTRQALPAHLVAAYGLCQEAIVKALHNPIRFAGSGGDWAVFAQPRRADQVRQAARLPNTLGSEFCLIVPQALWQTCISQASSLERQCVDAWSAFAVSFNAPSDEALIVQRLMARRPARPSLAWEQDQLLSLFDGSPRFVCPWTHQPLLRLEEVAFERLIPTDLRPHAALWNFIPEARHLHAQRHERLPSAARLAQAAPHLTAIYDQYQQVAVLDRVLREDAARDFMPIGTAHFAEGLAKASLRLAEALHIGWDGSVF